MSPLSPVQRLERFETDVRRWIIRETRKGRELQDLFEVTLEKLNFINPSYTYRKFLNAFEKTGCCYSFPSFRLLIKKVAKYVIILLCKMRAFIWGIDERSLQICLRTIEEEKLARSPSVQRLEREVFGEWQQNRRLVPREEKVSLQRNDEEIQERAPHVSVLTVREIAQMRLNFFLRMVFAEEINAAFLLPEEFFKEMQVCLRSRVQIVYHSPLFFRLQRQNSLKLIQIDMKKPYLRADFYLEEKKIIFNKVFHIIFNTHQFYLKCVMEDPSYLDTYTAILEFEEKTEEEIRGVIQKDFNNQDCEVRNKYAFIYFSKVEMVSFVHWLCANAVLKAYFSFPKEPVK